MFNKEILLQPKEAEKIFHTSIIVDSTEIIYRQPEYGYLSYEYENSRSYGSMNLNIYGKPCVYLTSKCERSGTFLQSIILFDCGSLETGNSKSEKVANIIYVTRLDTGVTAQFEWDDDLGDYGKGTTQLFSDDDVGKTIELEFVLE